MHAYALPPPPLTATVALPVVRLQVREGTGSAVFDLKYSCICFKPFKGEVLDVVVTSVNKVRAPRTPCRSLFVRTALRILP